MMLLALLAACGLEKFPDAPLDTGAPSFDDTDSSVYGSLAISPSSIDFGDVEPGDIAAETLVVTNTGDVDIGFTLLDVLDEAAFTVAETTATGVGAGEELVLTLSFSPSAEGSYDGTLTIETDDTEIGTVEVALTGTAGGGSGDGGDGGDGGSTEPGNIVASPTPLDFGTVDVGDSHSELITLENPGDEVVTLGAINLSGDAFGFDGCASTGDTVDPNDYTTCTIAFAPSSAGTATGYLQVAWSDAVGNSGMATVSLEGYGEEPCTICTPLIDVDAGEGAYSMPTFYSLIGIPHTQTITVENEGDEDLVISGVTINNDSVFSEGTFSTSFSSATLGPWESTEIDVSYVASALGTDLAYWELFGWDFNTLHIYSNDPTEPDYVVSLEGIGLNK